MQPFGIIMDLDGTLIDTPLDFEGIRASLGLPSGAPILEEISKRSIEEQEILHERLFEMEMMAAEQSQIIPGVHEFFHFLSSKGLKRAVFTRNSREVAEFTLSFHGLVPELLVAREDAIPKPDPAGLLMIQKQWGCEASQLLYLGDYLYDLQAGSRAGIRTLLYCPQEVPAFADQAHALYRTYEEVKQMVADWLGNRNL